FRRSTLCRRSRTRRRLHSDYGDRMGYCGVHLVWCGSSRHQHARYCGGSWARPVAIVRDLAIAIGFLIISSVLLNGLGYLLKVVPNQAIRNMLPQGHTEVILYLMLSLTAGFCE